MHWSQKTCLRLFCFVFTLKLVRNEWQCGFLTYREKGLSFQPPVPPGVRLQDLKKKQWTNRSQFIRPPYSEHRSSIVSKVFSTSAKMGLSQKTIHHSVAIIDAVFDKMEFMQHERVLVALVIVGIVTKITESEAKHLRYESISIETNDSFQTIRKTELRILAKLSFNINAVTVFESAQFFLGSGVVFSNDQSQTRELDDKLVRYIRTVAELLCDVSIHSKDTMTLFNWQCSKQDTLCLTQ